MSKTVKDGTVEGPKKLPWAGHLIQNALALMVSSGGTAVLGIAFWTVAAHLTTTENIGLASAEVAAMTLLANLAMLSFNSIFVRFLPIAGNRTGRFVTRSYAMCTLVAFVAAVLYVCLGFGHSFIPESFGWRVLFVAVVVLWTIFILQDAVLTGLKATRWVPVENILFAVAKLALLPAFLVVTARQGVFLAWSVPVVGAVGGVSWYLFRKRIPHHEAISVPNEKFPSIRELVSLGIGRYATTLISVFTPSLVVLIAIQRLGAVQEAYYYVPSLISNGVGLLLWGLVTSFIVEASTTPQELRDHTNVTIRATIIVVVPSVVIGVAFAPQILTIFGSEYAEHGTTLLRLLLLALPGIAITAFFSSFAWLDKRVWWLAVREILSAAVFFGILFALIGHFGILAIGIASLVSSVVQAIFFLPISIRRYRSIGHTESPTVETGTTETPES